MRRTIPVKNAKKNVSTFILATAMSFFLFIGSAQAADITIEKAQAWLESAYITWQAVDGAAGYNVYYTGEGISDKQIDTQLIREYGSYFRADVVGLKAGEYTITVEAIDENGIELAKATSSKLAVLPHDRTGFAFSNGHTPGAYNANGTPKAGAVVLYITEKTKNTVELDVLIDKKMTTCVGVQSILNGFKKGTDTRDLIVRFIGQVTDPATLDKGDLLIDRNAGKVQGSLTLEGIGDDAVADGWGIRLKGAKSVEIRNIGLMNCNSGEGDNIGLQQNNDYIWIHHCDFFYGHAGGDSDQAKGDGALDCKKSNYVTFSYNHFWDTGKSNLLGLSGESDDMYVSYHHNWYDHADSRHPRVRSYSVHVYNNYYDGVSKYGVGSTMGSSVFVEGNYFRNCKYPILTSMQGSDVWDASKGKNDYSNQPTFSKEDGGSIKAFNNYMEGQARFVAYGATGYEMPSDVDFDAYVATTRDERVPGSIKSFRGANAYNNFDTDPSIMYAYTAETPEQAKATVMAYAGRIEGGDFQWTFNNAVDDKSYDVNSDLKKALTDYKTKLVAIQGDGEGIGQPGEGEPGEGGGEEPGQPGGELPEGDVVHNFTTDGKNSAFFRFPGAANFATNKGPIQYAGLTLTQSLKIETNTVIEFSLAKKGTLVLVFEAAFAKGIYIDGTKITVPSGGILSIELEAGDHKITKGDTTSLFYMSVTFEEDPTSGIATPNATTRFTIYPNPVAHSVNIDTDATINGVEVYTIGGQRMASLSGNVTNVDMSAYPTGTYLIKIITETGIASQLVVKK